MSPISSLVDDNPFFILGCVRSGTTLLRDLLRLHPRLDAPEETHFFRWADPFGTPRYFHPYINNPGLKQQREMDGISEDEFKAIMANSGSKKEFAENYAHLFMQKRSNPTGRWFDKTPQNVYGILLISQAFPNAKFIHIHRHPFNVVASLYKGAVMSVANLPGATSYWVESMTIIDGFKQLYPQRLLEVPYESLTANPTPELERILNFLGEDPKQLMIPTDMVHPERQQYRKVLAPELLPQILERCEPYASRYGYSANP